MAPRDLRTRLVHNLFAGVSMNESAPILQDALPVQALRWQLIYLPGSNSYRKHGRGVGTICQSSYRAQYVLILGSGANSLRSIRCNGSVTLFVLGLSYADQVPPIYSNAYTFRPPCGPAPGTCQ